MTERTGQPEVAWPSCLVCEYLFTFREFFTASSLSQRTELDPFRQKLAGLTTEELRNKREKALGEALIFRSAYEDPDYGSDDVMQPEEAHNRMLIALAHTLIANRFLEERTPRNQY